jgi:hypothetical protein
MVIGIRRSFGAAALALIGAFALAPSAGAAPGQLVLVGCQRSADGPSVRGCTPLEGLGRTDELAVSPDGRFAYASWRRALSLFDRNPRSGRLSFVECVSATPKAPCRDVPGFLGVAGDIAIPRDGASLYFASTGFNRFVGFRRDPLDGRLSFSFCRLSSYGYGGEPSPPSDCPVGIFEEARQLEVSRDGRAVYQADNGCADNTGECYASVIAYRRNPETSRLRFRDRSDPASQGVGPFALSRSGMLYEVDSELGAISVFDRAGTDAFRRTQCLWRRPPEYPFAHCPRIPAMRRAQAIALAPHRMLVTAVPLGERAGGLVIFGRGRGGKLRFRRCLAPGPGAAALGCNSLRTPRRLSLARPEQLEMSRDRRSLYLVAGPDEARFLVRFKLNPKTGRIAFAQCFTPAGGTPCVRVPKLRGLIELSTAGHFLYAITGDRYRAPGIDALVRFRAKRR